MNSTLTHFNDLVQAEEYLEFFGVAYDPAVVNVNRLHILRKFSQFVREMDVASTDMADEAVFKQYRTALQNAYDLFQTSTPLEQKLFKVFQTRPKNVVMLSEIGEE